MPRHRLLSLLSAFVWLAATQALAQAPASPTERVREVVERIRDDPAKLVRGEAIAARRVLPELYANRGFSLAWGSAEARAELLRAIRDSAADGLDPQDYHLAALEKLADATATPPVSSAGLSSTEPPNDLWIDYDLLQ